MKEQTNFAFTSILLLLVLVVIQAGCDSNAQPSAENITQSDCAMEICSGGGGITYAQLDEQMRPERILNMGPVNFLNVLTQIKCHDVLIPSCRFPQSNWISKTQCDTLLSLLGDSTKCSALKIPSIRSYTENLDSAYIQSSTKGKESLRLLNGIVLKRYPCELKFNADWIVSKQDSIKALLSN